MLDAAPSTSADPDRDRAPRVRATAVVFWALLTAGAAWRVVWLFTDAMVLDADRGVVYLMATEVRNGGFPVMYWGQGYGGSVLPLVAGAVMLVAGSHLEVLGIVGVLFFAGSAVLVRSIAARAIGPVAGDVAGVVFWFPGYALFLLSLADPGFYGPTLAFALAAVLVALRGPGPRSYLAWAAAGLLAGLALWQSPTGGALALPALVIMIARHRSWRHMIVGVAGGALGALPWLVQLAAARATVTPLGGQSRIQLRSFLTFFSDLFAYALGALDPEPLRWVVTVVLVGLLVLLAVVALVTRNRWIAALAGGAALAYLVIIVGSGIPLRGDSHRYAVFLLPAVAVAIAWLATRLRPIAYVALFVFPAFTAAQAALQVRDLAFDTSGRFGVGMPALVQKLDEMDVRAVYADYWAAYSLTAKTDGRITADALTTSRYPRYADAAAAADPMVIVVYEDLENDQLLSQRTDLPPRTRTTAGGYAIYVFSRPFDVGAVWWNLF